MRVLPILFNTDMVRAILDGRKTVTRRCVKFISDKNPNWTGYVKDGLMLYNGTNEPCIKPCQYQPGDILYVRETWKKQPISDGCEEYQYRADFSDEENDCYGRRGGFAPKRWRPSIHMPKEASRIWLKVKDVRVERLQDIPHDGPMKEGIQYDECPTGFTWKQETDMHNCYTTPMGAMQALWDSTIKKSDLARYGWDASPWVWVIEFERCEKPEGI